jgi:hypothetical protein
VAWLRAALLAGGAVTPPLLPCDGGAAGAAVTGSRVDANPMTLASRMMTTAVTATQA